LREDGVAVVKERKWVRKSWWRGNSNINWKWYRFLPNVKAVESG
jgi:hypothetical protein